MSKILEVESLEVSFGGDDSPLKVVSEIDFSIESGKMLALVGESGSGKSITALSVLGLLPRPGRVSGGRIRFEGADLGTASSEEVRGLRGSRIGMVFQEPMTSLNPVYTVGFHLAEALGGRKLLSKEELRRRSLKLLAEVGIPEPEERLNAYPHQLSGGIRQRVMIACAFARNPRLLIADEPTTALDVTVEAQIMALLDRLKEERGAAILLVTHDLGLVAQHADQVSVTYAGFTVEEADTVPLFSTPLHPYTKALMMAMPGREGAGRLYTIPGTVPSAGNMGKGCPFRERCPEAFGRCGQELPKLKSYPDQRRVRCFKVESDAGR